MRHLTVARMTLHENIIIIFLFYSFRILRPNALHFEGLGEHYTNEKGPQVAHVGRDGQVAGAEPGHGGLVAVHRDVVHQQGDEDQRPQDIRKLGDVEEGELDEHR